MDNESEHLKHRDNLPKQTTMVCEQPQQEAIGRGSGSCSRRRQNWVHLCEVSNRDGLRRLSFILVLTACSRALEMQ